MRILVADKLAEEGLDFLKQSGMEFDTKIGLKEDELAATIGQYDAMVVRSGFATRRRAGRNVWKTLTRR